MDYKHLDPSIVSIVEGDQLTRERYLFRDKFIEYDAAAYVLRRLHHLANFPRRIRMPGLIIGGDAGMGKTTLLHRFQKSVASSIDTPAAGVSKPVAYAQAPTGTSQESLTDELMYALDGPSVDVSRRRARRIIRDLLAEMGTRIVMFDEVQHIARLKRDQRLSLIDWFKELGTNAQIPIVCAGVRGVEQMFKDDPQIRSRFSYVELKGWTDDARLASFLHTYEKILPLKKPSRLARKTMVKSVLKEAGNSTDQLLQCLSYAALQAMRTGEERITVDLLKAWNDPPLLDAGKGEGNHEKR